MTLTIAAIEKSLRYQRLALPGERVEALRDGYVLVWPEKSNKAYPRARLLLYRYSEGGLSLDYTVAVANEPLAVEEARRRLLEMVNEDRLARSRVVGY